MSKVKARKTVVCLSRIVIESVKAGYDVQLAGLGTFSAKQHEKKRGHDIRDTAKTIELPSMVRPRFKASRSFKKALRA